MFIKKGNPRSVSGIEDVGRQDVTFVNRRIGAGTRILLNAFLADQNVPGDAVRGCDRDESSHTAVTIRQQRSFLSPKGSGLFSVLSDRMRSRADCKRSADTIRMRRAQ